MPIYRTTRLAEAVLANVEWLMSEEDEYILEHYQNGRERGFTLRNSKKELQVAFSENRNSDSIVLYLGKFADFEMAGNVPSDEVYSKKEFFSYNESAQAAKRVIEYLGGN